MTNTAPILSGLGPTVTLTASSTPQFIDQSVIFGDEEDNFDGGSLTISGLVSGDVVSIGDDGEGPLDYDSGNGEIRVFGEVIGIATGGVGNDLEITFNATADSFRVELVIENLTFHTTSLTPAGSRQLIYSLLDDEGAQATGGLLPYQDVAGDPFEALGSWRTAPTFADIDGDLDLDLVSGNGYGSLQVWYNSGGALTTGSNPFASYAVSYDSAPTFADVVGDGALDVIIGNSYGDLLVVENDGGAYIPPFFSGNPLAGISSGGSAKPVFGDIDEDGDQDLVLGGSDGTLRYYRRDGFTSYTQLTGVSNPFNGIDVGFSSAPALGDIDGDGDLDLVVGDSYGQLRTFLNDDGDFDELVGSENPFNGVDLPYGSTPAFGDFDGDGDLDLVIGDDYGGFRYLEASGVVGITVDLVTPNNPPSGTDATRTLLEEGSHTFTLADFGYSDADGDTFTGVRITTVPAGELRLVFIGGSALVSAGDTVNASDIAAGQLRFTPARNLSGTAATSFTFQVVDDGGTEGGGVDTDPTPNTITFDITGVNDAPHGANKTLNVATSGSHVFSAGDFGFADIDGNSLSEVRITSTPDAGSLTLNGSAVAAGQFVSIADINAGLLVFTPVAGQSGARYASFWFQVRDNGGTANGGYNTDITPNTFTVNVGVGTAPVFSGWAPSVSFMENTVNAAPQLLDGDVELSDLEENWDGGTLSLGGLAFQDQFSIRDQGTAAGEVGYSGGVITFGGTAVGTGSTAANGTLTVTFNASATSEAVEAVVENLTFQNVADTPTASRTVTLNLTDGAGQAISNTLAPAFTEKTGAGNNPMHGLNFGASTKSQFADLDFDGDLDLLNGSFNGQVTYFLNTGTSVAPVWSAQTGGSNPFNGVDVGYHARPTLADIDGDGDLDAYIGEGFSGSMRFYRNTGSATAPVFTQETGGSNPFNGITWKYVADPTLADFDGDGDYDLMIAAEDGINPDPDTSFRYWRNTGTATAPVFTEQTGGNNPLDGVDVGDSNNAIFADIDKDEDLDLVIGFDSGQFRYFRNTGSVIAPVFVEQLGSANPFNGIDVGYQAAMPSFADLDGDGDLDLIADGYSSVRYWQNGGSAFSMAIDIAAQNDAPSGTAAFFELLEDQSLTFTLANFGFSDPEGHGFAAVKITELPTNGLLKLNGANVTAGDVIAASAISSGQLVFTPGANENSENTAGGSYYAEIDFQVQDNGGTANGGADLDPTPDTLFIYVQPVNDPPLLTGFSTSVTFAENPVAQLIDGAVTFSDPDNNYNGGALAISGLLAGDVVSIRNQGNGAGEIGFNSGTGEVRFGGTLIGVATGGNGTNLHVTFNAAATASAIEALVENLTYSNNDDTPTLERTLAVNILDAPSSFSQQNGAANPFNADDVGYHATPTLADLDGDGDLDMMTGSFYGTHFYWQNTGTPSAPTFVQHVGATNPFNGVNPGNLPTPSFADLDDDGDLDAVLGEQDGVLNYYENTGTASAPVFTQRTGTANPFNNVDIGSFSAADFGDFDADGDLDAVIGENGEINYFRNDGTAAAPVFVQQTGAANPFHGVTVQNGAPAIADLDGDGDLDVLMGTFYGDFWFFENVGSNAAPDFQAVFGEGNPLNGFDVGFQAKPTLGDLDGDGDMDLLAGNAVGNFRYYKNDGFGAFVEVEITPVNDAPSGADKTITVNEDTAYVFAAADFGFGDVDGHSLAAVKITTLPGAGTLKLNGANVSAGATVSLADIAAGLLAFTPGANANGAAYAAFTFQVQDNGGTANGGVDLDPSANTMTVNVTAVNDAPVLTGFGPTVTFNENVVNAGPQLLDTNVSFTDVEGNFTGGTLSVSGLLAQDTVSIRDEGSGAGQIGFSGGSVTYGGVAIGTASGGAGSTLTITFNANASSAAIDALIQNLTYANASNTPTASRTLTVTVTDAAGAQNPGPVSFGSAAGPPGVANNAAPDLADLDGDGDVDMVVGTGNGLLAYYENTGTASAPNFVRTLPLGSGPFNSADIGYGAAPTLADLDGDGDIDAFVGNANGTIHYFRNTGTTSSPNFVQQTGGANPFNGVDIGDEATPEAADLDGDGDLDVLVGAFNGTIKYFRNTGTASAPVYIEQTGAANPFNLLDVGDQAAPRAVDVDEDGDLDLVVATFLGPIAYFENTGTTSAPTFVSRTGTNNPFNGITHETTAKVGFADVDNDGNVDFFYGGGGGALYFHPNTTGFGAPITVTVTAQNDAPSGADKTVSINENGEYVFARADFGFSDLDGNAFAAVKISTIPGEGALTLDGVAVNAGDFVSVAALDAGDLVFTPAVGEDGLAYGSFTFQVQDDGGTANGGANLDPSANSFTIDVIGINDPPDGTDKTVTVLEDGAYAFAAADFGFSDPEEGHSLLAVKITTLPSNGTLTLDGAAVNAGDFIGVAALAAGDLVFTPAANANGAGYASFTFQVQDNGGTAAGGVDLDQSPNTITVNVTPVNDAPSGANKTVVVLEDGSHTFATSDFGFSDVLDGHALLAVKISTLPPAGSLTLDGVAVTEGQSVSAADIAAGLLVYTPAANANGMAYGTFTFQVQDNGGTANGGVDTDAVPNFLHINVTAVNDAPAGSDNTVTLLEDGSHTFAAADFGFSDTLDGNALAAVKITSLPANGALTLDGVAVTAGDFVSVAALVAGDLVYTPAANANGPTYASFTFQVQDNGGTSNDGVDLDQSANTITLAVTAVNDAPSGTDKTVTLLEDGSHTFAAADFGFSDALDGHSLAAVKITTLPSNGSLTLDGSAVNAGDFVSVAALAAGDLVFTPAANANGPTYASFTFQVQNNGGTSNDGVDLDQSANTITLAVTAVNDAPSGTDKTVTLLEDGSHTFAAADFGFSDALDGHSLAAVKITTLPSNGSLTLDGTAVNAGDFVSVAALAAGDLVFTPAANGNGPTYASFTFQVQDNGGTSNGGVDLDQSANTITLAVTAVNDAPSGTDKTVTLLEDGSHTFAAADFGFSDALDGHSLAAVKITTLPSSGSLTLNGASVATGQSVSAADITAGLLVFTPAANGNGPTYASFTFQVQDSGGTSNGGIDLDPSANTITLAVTAVNDAPSGTDKTVTLLEDASHTFAAADFGFSDALDGHALAAVKISTLPVNGSLRLNGVVVTTGQSVAVADISAGLLVFTPAANANGPTYASFTFQVQDSGGTSNGGIDLDPSANTITLAVTAVNDAPSGANKTVTLLEDASHTFAAADFGFSDAIDGHALSAVKIASLPANGSLTLNGAAVTTGQSVAVADINAGLLVFTPAANANGAGYANFTFQVQDSGGTVNGGVDTDPSPNTITLNVTSVNDAPSGADKTITSNEDTTYIFAAADFGFTDAIDGNALQAVRIASLPTAGALRLAGVAVVAGDVISVADINLGRLRFFPAANANGDGYANFSFQVRDNGGTANGGVNLDPTANTITFNITSVNDAPAFSGLAASKTVAENAAPQLLDGNVTLTDVEGNFDGGTLTVSQLLAEDMVSIRHQGGGAGQIGYNALTGAVSYQGVQIGTAEGGAGEDLVVTLNASATALAVEALIEAVTYENDSEAPTLSRTLRLSVLDAATGAASALIAVNVTPANDAPVITAPSSYAANVGVKRALGGISFADPDAGAAQVTATLAVTAGTLTANASGGVAVTGSGTSNMTLTGTIGALNAFMAAEKVSFTSDGTGNDPLLTLTIDDGGASGGPAQTDQVVIAISVADNRTGTNGKDVMIGLAENSRLDGLGGADTLSGGGGNDTLLGGAGNDLLNGGIGDDTVDGGADTDTASYDGAASGVTVSLAAAGQQNTGGAGLDTLIGVENLLGSDFADTLTGDGGANVITGGTGADTIGGGGGDDQIVGGDGIDVIDGGDGADVIYGRGEADVLTGGTGGDRFAFQLLSDSRKADPDLITDLAAEDFVDVRAIDANANKDGNQAFQLVAAFTNKAAQAMLSYDAGLDQTSLLLDVDADGKSDMTIVFAGDQRGFTNFVL